METDNNQSKKHVGLRRNSCTVYLQLDKMQIEMAHKFFPERYSRADVNKLCDISVRILP
jgi:hypothetical protein